MRWDDLSCLLAVYRGGSLSAAGSALRLDPSTVSRRLRALEDAVGGALFVRTPDGMRATALALRVLPHAEQAEAAVLAAQAAAAGAEQRVEGRVRIAAAEGLAAYVLAPAMPDFLRRHPALSVDILASPHLADLSRREADIAVRFVRPEAGDLVMKSIGRSGQYRAFATRAYAAAHPDAASLDWISWRPELASLPEAQLFRAHVGRPARMTSGSMVVMLEALLAGAGAMLLPERMAGVEGGLVPLDCVPPIPFEVQIWLVTLRALRHVPRVQAVWSWLEELLGSIEASAGAVRH